MKIEIYLNGKPVTRAFYANSERGEVRRFVTDENDKHIIDRDNEEFLTETLFGDVIVIVNAGEDKR